MRNPARVFAALLLPITCAADGVDPLANGLDGDVTATAGSSWSIEDGVLIPERGEDRGYLVTKARYANLEITFEVNPETETNSGVFTRCQETESITPENCVEFNIWDDHPNQDRRTGAVVPFAPPVAMVDTVGKWNTMRIRLEGSRLQFWINGTLTNDVEDDRFAEGHVAFQYGGSGGMVKFRNIRIEELP